MKQELLAPADDPKALTVAQPPDMLSMIERLASNQDFSVEKLKALLDMKERIDARAAEAEFDAAFAVMQGELSAVSERAKTNTGTYAPLEDIVDTVRPILSRHGFSLSFETEWPAENDILIIGILAHRMGHKRRSRFRSGADSSGSKNAIQAKASAVTYGKRYAACDLLCIVTRKDDDDGVAAQRRNQKQAPAGFDDWLIDLETVAEEGTVKLRAAWQDSKPEYRDHLATMNGKSEALKLRAKKADGVK